jgi:tetratricopeptide (TPR) repeat protein
MNEDNQHQTTDTLNSPSEQEAEDTSEHVFDEDHIIAEEISKCEVCGNPIIEEGYSLALCNECRDKLSKRPMPVQIKISVIVLILIIMISLVKFPSTIRIGVEYERGIEAEKALKYVTAMKHYENVAKNYPDSDKVEVRLLNTYYQNEKINEVYNTFDKLAGPSPDSKKMDSDLVDEVNAIMDNVDLYYNPSKELYEKLKVMKNPTSEELVTTIKPFVDKNPKEVYGAMYLADVYFEAGKYDEANNILSNIVSAHPDFYSALIFQASTLRELGQYDKAIELAQKALKHNVEDTGAIAALSKIELKRKNNAQGLEYAKQAYNVNSSEPFIVANLSLAYHYNNMIKERDESFKTYQSYNDNDKYTSDLLTSIFNGSLQWQK